MEELERQRQPRQTPTQALAQGGCASSGSVGPRRRNATCGGSLSAPAGLGARRRVVAFQNHTTHGEREEGSSVAVAAAGGGAAGMVGVGRRRKGRSSRRSSSSRMWSTIRSSRPRGPLMMAGATHRPRGIPRCASDGRSDCRVAAGVDRDTPQAAAVGIGAGAVAAAAAAGSGRGGQVVAGGAFWMNGASGRNSGAAAEAASRGVADGLQQQPSLSQARRPAPPSAAGAATDRSAVTHLNATASANGDVLCTSAVPSPPSLATASAPSALSDGRSPSSRPWT